MCVGRGVEINRPFTMCGPVKILPPLCCTHILTQSQTHTPICPPSALLTAPTLLPTNHLTTGQPTGVFLGGPLHPSKPPPPPTSAPLTAPPRAWERGRCCYCSQLLGCQRAPHLLHSAPVSAQCRPLTGNPVVTSAAAHQDLEPHSRG